MDNKILGMNNTGKMTVVMNHIKTDSTGDTNGKLQGPVVSHHISITAENCNATGSQAFNVNIGSFTLDIPALARIGLETGQFDVNDWIRAPVGDELVSIDPMKVSRSFMELLGKCLIYEASRTEYQDSHTLTPSTNPWINENYKHWRDIKY